RHFCRAQNGCVAFKAGSTGWLKYFVPGAAVCGLVQFGFRSGCLAASSAARVQYIRDNSSITVHSPGKPCRRSQDANATVKQENKSTLIAVKHWPHTSVSVSSPTGVAPGLQ